MPDPIISELLDMFADTVTIEPYLGENRFGKANYGPAFECRAKVTGRTKTAIDSDGNERVTNCQVILAGAFGVTVQDRFTLPVRFSLNPQAANIEDRQPRAIAVDQESDENGPHHETIYFSITPKNRVF